MQARTMPVDPLDRLVSSEPEAVSSSSLKRLETMARTIVPDGVAVACGGTDGDVSQLFDVERKAVERAASKRRMEFAAGREAARSALQQLGHPAVAIPMGTGRSPVWPSGFVGSIAHCKTAAIAVAAAGRNIGFVGVDIEESQPLDRDLWESICTKNEIAMFHARPDAGLWGKVFFSIKEAVYKAQYPETGRLLDFNDVEISLLQDTGRFAASILVGDLNSVSGSFQANNEFILAFAATAPSF